MKEMIDLKKGPVGLFAKVCLVVLFVSSSLMGWGQVATWNQTWSGTAASPLAAASLGSNVASASLARVNLVGASSSGRHSSTTWNSTSNYLTVTVTASSGYVLNLNGVAFQASMGSSGTGPSAYTLYSSVNSYASSIGTLSTSCTSQQANSVTLPASGYNGLSTITFRIVAVQSGCSSTFASGGTGGPSLIVVGGSAVPSCSTPTLSTVTQSATICTGTSATISLAGLVASSTGNAIDYTINGVAQTQVTGISADASGNATFSTGTLTTANNGQTLVVTKITNGTCSATFTKSTTLSVIALPANPSGTITPSANPSCGPATLTYSAPSSSIYWQTVTGGTSTTTPTTSSYTLSSTGFNGYVRAYNGTCWSTSTLSTASPVTIYTPTAITTQPATTITPVCQGATISSLSVGAAGQSVTYQWYQVTTPVNTGGTLVGTSQVYPPSSATPGTTYYYCIVTGASPCGKDTSNASGPVVVNPVPATPSGTISISANPSCGPATLSYSAPDPNIYWETSSGSNATTNPTSSNYIQTGTGATIYVRAYNGLCGVTGPNTGTITIRTAPTISATIADKTVTAPGGTSFSVSGTNIAAYQWQYNDGTGWQDVSGATTATYTIAATTNIMDGYLYRCVVSNSPCANDTSNAATLNVINTVWNNAITVANPSADNPYTTGDFKDPNVTVSGIKRGAGLAAVSISGRYAATSWTTATSPDLTDYFEFVMTPASGYQIDFTSFVYTGTLSTGTASYALRSSLDGFTANIGTATAGTTISLTAGAYQIVTTPITFRFYAYGLSSSTASYGINDFSFIGKVTPAGCIPPTITGTTPASTVCGAGAVTLSATASSGMVKWYTVSTGGSAIDSGATLTRTISATTTYYADATDVCTSTTRAAVTATLTTQPTTPASATPAAVCAGSAATITGTGSTGAIVYTYWTLLTSGSLVTSGTTPAGTISGNNLTTPISLASGSYTYYVQGENGSCVSANRQAVTVTVNPVPSNPTGTITPAANPACGSTTLTYSAPSTTIYWQTAPGNTSTANPTTSAYTLSSTGTIYARAYNGSCWSAGTVSSASVTINPLTAITTQPANQNVSVGNSATFTVAASGAGLSYQWRKGGVNISGATSSTYTIPTAALTDAGTYSVVVTGTCGTVTSGNAVLTVSIFTYRAGDYRSTSSATTLASNNSSTTTTNNWEYYDGTSWGPTPAGKAPANATTTPTRVIIAPGTFVDGAGNNTKSYHTIVVQNNGWLDLAATGTPTVDFILSGDSLEVQNGGFLSIEGQISINSNAKLIVRNGGIFDIESPYIDNRSVIWAGTENFEPGSEVYIADWGITSTGSGSLYNTGTYPSGNISNNAKGYKFGILSVDVDPGTADWTLVGGGVTLNLCDTLNVDNASSASAISMMSNTSSPTVTVGRINHRTGLFALSASFSGAATQTLNITENLNSNTGYLQLFYAAGGTPGTINVNLAGNLTLGSGVYFDNDATTGTTTALNFTGTATQYIDAATQPTGIPMNINSGAYVALKNNNLDVSSYSGLTAIITVKTGATFDFGFAADNITALVIKKSITGGTNQFVTQQGSTLKITSPDGIQLASATTGNVQFASTNKTFNQLATFWYTGRANQVTGDALTTASNGKQLIIEMNSNALSTTLTQSTGLTNATTISTTGGKLDIRKGKFIETLTGYITGSTGTLYMAGGTLYQTPVLSTSSTDVIPRIDGVSYAYALNGGTVELSGAGSQTLRGSRTYYNVKYSGSNIYGTNYKNMSNDAVINDSLIVSGSTTVVNCVDGSLNPVSFTGAGGVVMDGGRLMIKTLNTTSPQLTGVNVPYNLAGGTVEFYGSAAATHQVIRATDNSGTISYNNIDVNASTANTADYNVGSAASFVIKGALTVNSPAVFQLDETENVSGPGSFEVKAGATFKYGSANGIKTSGTATSDGNIRITGTRTLSTSASYGFVGNGSMVSGNGLPATMVNMYIQKSGASDVVTLTNSAAATGVISFTKGLVSTGTNELISNNTSTSSITGYAATRYVIGNLRRYVGANGSYDYPVGNASYYDLATLNFNGQSGITSLLGFFNTGQSGTTPSTTSCAINGTKINNYLNNGFWTFTPNATMSGGTYDITLNATGYTNPPSAANRMGIIKRANASSPWLGCGLLNGAAQPSSYGTHSNATQSIAAGVATASRSGATGFSEFGIGLPFKDIALPVQLLYLNATAVDNHLIHLDWATASEINNSGFEIERSTDGVTFENIGWVDGHGTTNVLITYNSDDKQVTPNVIYYYRLKQMDIDGHYEYTNIVSAALNGSSGFAIEAIRPNPASSQVALDIVTEDAQSVSVSFTDMLGREVLGRTWQLNAGLNDTKFDISTLAEGMYHVTVKSANSYYTKVLAVAK